MSLSPDFRGSTLLTPVKLSVAVASMIAAFKFDREYKDGIPVPLNDNYEEGSIWYEFQCLRFNGPLKLHHCW